MRTSVLSHFKSSTSTGMIFCDVESLPTRDAISQRASAVPALNVYVESEKFLTKVGRIKLLIFSVARFFKQAVRLVTAAFFTSYSSSERSWVKV